MHPRLLTTPYFTIYTFGVFLAAGYMAALWWIVRAARRQRLDSDRMMSLGLWAIVGAVLGAKILMVVRTLPDYLADPSQLLSLSTLQSAGDFYGGFLGSLVAVSIYFARTPQLPVWRTADICAPAIALGQAIGRIGCFMAGDDYGSATAVPWAVTFTDPDAYRIGGAPLGVPLHPVQLYESVTCLVIFLFLVWLSRRPAFKGRVILSYTLLYAAARFTIEFFRGDEDRGFVLHGLLSTSQLIAVVLTAVALVLWWKRRAGHETGRKT
jgi:phosphatidylglycerol---prolipoprotein diacylglyceryl transferase